MALSPSASRKEREYIQILRDHLGAAYLAVENAPVEGFAYFASKEYRKKFDLKGSLVTDKFNSVSKKDFPRFFRIMVKNAAGIFGARRRSFADISSYMDNFKRTGRPGSSPEKLTTKYPNTELWSSLSSYAWEEWGVLFGFTEVPEALIFRGKAILFKYALVAIQEMDKDKIDTAPALDAGEEVLAVYNSLGRAVNDIARWLRENYGVRCQANHPLGGLVTTVPLAVKAGMGWGGSNGLLITPEFGQRQRIAPIFVDAPIFKFTDSQAHRWIEDYCDLCGRCRNACPTNAVLEEKKIGLEQIEGLGPAETGIEREKCYPYFNATLGCSICVKVCPFSKANGTYSRLRKVVEKRKTAGEKKNGN